MFLFAWIMELLVDLWAANVRLAETDLLAESSVARQNRSFHRRLFAGALILVAGVAAIILCVRMW